MFLSRNKKNNVYPCKLQFYYRKGGFKGVKIIYACFPDVIICEIVFNTMSCEDLDWTTLEGGIQLMTVLCFIAQSL